MTKKRSDGEIKIYDDIKIFYMELWRSSIHVVGSFTNYLCEMEKNSKVIMIVTIFYNINICC
jgi:hypothetical protein